MSLKSAWAALRARLPKTNTTKASAAPQRLATHDDFMRRQRRFYLLVVALMGLLSLCSLFVALVAFARPMPVVMWDREDGAAVLVQDTKTPRLRLEEWQIKATAKLFAERFVGFAGPVARRDAAQAANMMTERFRTIYMADERAIALIQERDGSNIEARILRPNIKIGRYDPDNLGGSVHVVLTATRQFSPLVGDGKPESDYVLLRLVLMRVPLSPDALLGLKVDFANVQTFPTIERLNAALAKAG